MPELSKTKEPKLLVQGNVQPGFEVVIDNPDIEMCKLWNLWFNVILTDNPGSWDNEILMLNKMQSKLNLDIDHRLIRAQMAEFCRYHPSFPQGIEVLCQEIGEGRFSAPIKIGCEGRGLLESFGYHNEESISNQVKDILTSYRASIEKWIKEGTPNTSLDRKIYDFLGDQTEKKKLLVEMVRKSIDPENLSILPLLELSKNIISDVQDASGARPFNCFNCLPKDVDAPGCKCSYAMVIDSALLYAGEASNDKFKLFTEMQILEYSISINSWLNGEPPNEFGKQIHTLLGEKDDVKIWLVGCLLKTITGNQRWHGTGELIDKHPEAISWFKASVPSR
ncbi:MAG: hypothetical protein KAS67_03790 [Thermoplasmata archaeon]|nr:hypothetical protein [Thermoplasmata archaeon]